MTALPQLHLKEDGCVILNSRGENREFDFNKNYKGYYPSCRWTAAGRGDLLYLAGTDEDGRPHLFSSARGEVWTEVNIFSRSCPTDLKKYGDIVCILFERESRQVFLIGGNGYLITLPDCPKCVRARKISDQKLTDGRMEKDMLLIREKDSGEIRIRVSSALQYRCSFSYAQPILQKGGLLFDLRSPQEQQKMMISAAIRLDPNELGGLLWRMPKARPLFFFCSRGYLADQAAREARDAGFSHAFSLGGIYDIVEDQTEE